MSSTPRPDDLDLYVDGLLGPSEHAAFEERLAHDAPLRDALETQQRLERSLRARFTPPAHLGRPRHVAAPLAQSTSGTQWSALATAAGVLLAASLVFGLTLRGSGARGPHLDGPPSGDETLADTELPGPIWCDGEAGLALDGAYARLERELATNPMVCGPTLTPFESWPGVVDPYAQGLELPDGTTSEPPGFVGCTLPDPLSQLDLPPVSYTQPPGFPLPVRVDELRPLHGPFSLPTWPGAPGVAVESAGGPHFVFAVERHADPHPRLAVDAHVELIRAETGEHIVYELKPVGQPSCLDLFCPR